MNECARLTALRGDTRQFEEHRGRITMSEVGELYYCDRCGAKVRVLEGGDGELVCCRVPMKKVSG